MASSDGPEFIFSGQQQGDDHDEWLVTVFDDVIELASRADSHERWSMPITITRFKDREIHTTNEEQS